MTFVVNILLSSIAGVLNAFFSTILSLLLELDTGSG